MRRELIVEPFLQAGINDGRSNFSKHVYALKFMFPEWLAIGNSYTHLPNGRHGLIQQVNQHLNTIGCKGWTQPQAGNPPSSCFVSCLNFSRYGPS